MTATTAQPGHHTSLRLTLLPTAIGLLAMVLLAVGMAVSGVVGAESGRGNGPFLIALLTALLLTTVISGVTVGMYFALAGLVILGLAHDGTMSTVSLVLVLATTVAVHETTRFSLDARKPTRLGPGLVTSYLMRSLVIAGLAIATAVALSSNELPTLDRFFMPIGLAAASIPLFSLYLFKTSKRLKSTDDTGANIELRWTDQPLVRGIMGAIVAVAAVAIVAFGAQARTAIESPEPPVAETTPSVTTTTTTPTDVVEIAEAGELTGAGRNATMLIIGALALVLIFLLLALKRPEAEYELDELDIAMDDHSFGFAGPARADMDFEHVEISDEELANLLDGLRLDIEAETDPGRAIRFGYANIERRLSGLGVERSESETEQEFLDRTLNTLGPEGQAMVDLTRLFEHARFGQEPVAEAMRADALQAIEQLHDAVTKPEPKPSSLVRPQSVASGDAMESDRTEEA